MLQFLCDGFAFNKLFVQQLPEKREVKTIILDNGQTCRIITQQRIIVLPHPRLLRKGAFRERKNIQK